ncbi:NAD-dependent epimerase/dehydratase family protein [Actinomadura rudentiformis]|uniref:SDR family NAD(P)-dependent oxidoreductase n=1 Tax=Actinomadura rudentiformis TaxID=359158 RepID=A0A6H9YZZ6_9ACTN|nr:SDR family NAD(P)-dependent oxidoreductase [Actinomadura rudentiformis]KAB2346163.1 SDR family NAD(P)-dependent oxidoreductase [Actinomadura rudentiformis]
MPNGSWAGKTVVVTGGAGFIGSHIVEQLLEREASVICLYRRDRRGVLAQLPDSSRLRTAQLDLRDEDALSAVFELARGGVDAFFHCAAVSGSVEFRRDHSGQILDTNMRVTSNVLKVARTHGVPDVALLSSSDIYLNPETYPIHEDDDFTRQMKYVPDGYYLSKVYAEILAETHRIEYGTNIFLPRLTSVYGPRDNFEPDTDRVVPSMFAKVMAGQEIEIWGDGSQTRTYMHVTDLVRAVLRMVEVGKHHVLNIGTSEIVTVHDLARLVCEALEEPERIRFDPARSGGRPNRTLDVGRLYDVIDFEPRSLRDGLRDTVEWYRRHRVPARAAR